MLNKNNMHSVRTASNCLNHFIFRGFYNTYIGERLGLVNPAHRDDAIESIGKLYCRHLTMAFENTFPSDFSDDFKIEYERVYSPHCYNFETDSVEFEFAYSQELNNWMFGYAGTHMMEFENFLAENYTSHDGFISYTSNNYDDWCVGYTVGNYRDVSAILCFIIDKEINSRTDEYNCYFDEDVNDLITEIYIDSEYTALYKNGYVAVVRGTYDYDTGEDCFDCWLLDEDNNVVNYICYNDPWCELNGSGYAAFCSVEYDLTKKYSFTGILSEQCNAPEFSDAIKNVDLE